jgi:hypothetical protein
LLAEDALRPDSLHVICMRPLLRSILLGWLVEVVNGEAEGRVSPLPQIVSS